jgi:KUP system potassium uptake protein
LFAFQQVGTNVVGKIFGPIMMVWFAMIAYLGIVQIFKNPSVLAAINPYYAINLVVNYHGENTAGFWLLGSVFLCTTGGEALYSDLGHCGKQNIRVSWGFVWVCLLLSYFGQSAWLLSNFDGKALPDTVRAAGVFYGLMPKAFLPYGVAIATMATVIASQALITGSFTLVNEAMKLRLWVNMKVSYPTQLKGQIYIPAINWFLMFGCIAVVLIFRKSTNMEAAYGLAIIFNMLMTTSLLLHYLYMKDRKHNTLSKKLKIYAIGFLFISIETAFFISNMDKFEHGGWFSCTIAAVLFITIFVFYKAKALRQRHTDFVPISNYVPMLEDLMNDESVPKEATNLVYMAMADNEQQIDANIIYSIFRKRPKRADIYWFVHVVITDEPFEKKYKVYTIVPGKVFFVRLKFGFKVEHKVNLMFSEIVKQMQANGEIDEISHYPSLRKYGLPADFKFILLNSRVSVDMVLNPINQWIIRFYRLIKKIGLPPAEDFGLEMSNVETEMVPIKVGEERVIEMCREE